MGDGEVLAGPRTYNAICFSLAHMTGIDEPHFDNCYVYDLYDICGFKCRNYSNSIKATIQYVGGKSGQYDTGLFSHPWRQWVSWFSFPVRPLE